MKRLALLLVLAASPAWAQPPEEVIATDTIKVRMQQARTYNFDRPIKDIKLSVDGVAQVLPETDRTITIRGQTQGRTIMTAYASDGNIVYRANIEVLQIGGYVKIYGQGDMEEKMRIKDFISFYCTETGCGRANPDFKSPPATEVSETLSKTDGDSVKSSTTTKRYPSGLLIVP